MVFSVPIGSAGVFLGVVLFFSILYLSSDTTVTCHDTGFTVNVVSKKKGTSIQEYKWEEVTETKYFVKDGGDDGADTRYFLVNTEKGTAFKLASMKGFDELISIINEKTPHLPYTWIKKRGLSSYYIKQER